MSAAEEGVPDLQSTLFELQSELEKKRIEVIQVKASINTRLEEQQQVVTDLEERLREAINEEKALKDEQRKESTNANAVRLLQINMEMDTMKEKVERLASREQLGAAGLVRMSAMLTDLEKKAKEEYTAEVRPLTLISKQLLEDCKANTQRLIPILGESEAAAASKKSLARLIREGHRQMMNSRRAAAGKGKSNSNDEDDARDISIMRKYGAGDDDEDANDDDDDFSHHFATASSSAAGNAQHIVSSSAAAGNMFPSTTDSLKSAGSPIEFSVFQRESCASSVAMAEGAEVIKSNVIAFAKEVTLEYQLFSALFKREVDRHERLQEEVAAQTEALGASQVVAKDLAEGLIVTQDRLHTINDRIAELTKELNEDKSLAIETEIESTKKSVMELDQRIQELSTRQKLVTAGVEDARAELKMVSAATQAVLAEKERIDQQRLDYEQQLDAIAADTAAQNTKRHAVEDKLHSLEQQKLRLVKALAEAELSLDAARDKQKAKENELADAESELRIAKSSAEGREQTVEPLKARLAQIREETAALTKEKVDSATKKLEASVKLEENKRKLAALKESNAAKEKEVAYLKTLLAQRSAVPSAANTPTTSALEMPRYSSQQPRQQPSMHHAGGPQQQHLTNNDQQHTLLFDSNQPNAQPTQFAYASSNSTVSRTASSALQQQQQPQQQQQQRTQSVADAYLQSLGASPELVVARSSRGPSVTGGPQNSNSHSDIGVGSSLLGGGGAGTGFGARYGAGGGGSEHAAMAGYAPFQPTMVAAAPVPQQQPQQVRPPVRDLTAEYGYIAARDEAAPYQQQQQQPPMSAIERMKQRSAANNGGAPMQMAMGGQQQQQQQQQQHADASNRAAFEAQYAAAAVPPMGMGPAASVSGGSGYVPAAVMNAMAMDRPNSHAGAGQQGGAGAPPPSMANINSRLSAILERKNRRGQTGGFF